MDTEKLRELAEALREESRKDKAKGSNKEWAEWLRERYMATASAKWDAARRIDECLAAQPPKAEDEWRDVVGSDVYEVSRSGLVRRKGSDRYLKPSLTGRGYMAVNISGKSCRVHRLVAEAFHGPSDGREVNHKDGVKANNAAGNLEWVTRAENEIHSRRVLHNLCTPITATRVDGTEERRFHSITETEEGLHLKRGRVWECLAGHRKTLSGWRFARANDATPTAAADSDRLDWLTEEHAVLESDGAGRWRVRFGRALNGYVTYGEWAETQREAIDAARHQESGK